MAATNRISVELRRNSFDGMTLLSSVSWGDIFTLLSRGQRILELRRHTALDLVNTSAKNGLWLARVDSVPAPASPPGWLNPFLEIPMRTLVPRNPLFREMTDFRREFDQMFNRFFNWRSPQEEQALTEGFIPAIEASIDKMGRNSSVRSCFLVSIPKM